MATYVFDTETTDREAGREIIEAAWVRLQCDGDADTLSLEEGASFARRYMPGKPVTFGSLAVHHILPIELEGCPPSSAFALPPDATYIVGHSIDFDWEAAGKPPVKRICTYAMAQQLWPGADSHSQSALLYLLCGATPETRAMLRGAHGAAVDVANNLILLGHILAAKPEITTWSALWEFSEMARIPTIMPMGRNRGAPIAQLETSEMFWYLDRDFIDPYLRKAFEQEIERRHAALEGDEEAEELDDASF